MSQTTSYPQVEHHHGKITLRRALLVGLLGGSLAAVGNLILFFLIDLLTGIDLLVPTGPGGSLVPLTPLDVGLTSFIPGLLAGVVLWVLDRATKEPMQIFLGVSISVLLFSFTAPLGMATIPNDARVVLVIMHVIAAGAIAGVLAKYGKW